MTQSISCSIILGANHAGLSDLRAQLYDTAGATVGSPVSTGFVVLGNAANGNYGWTGNVADDFQGFINFYSLADATIAAMVTINQLAATTFPAGANEVTITVNNSITSLPIDGAKVWITTDLVGTNTIWAGTSDAFGIARNVLGEKPFLNTGTYYAWIQDSGYTDTNPTTLNVS